MSLSHALGSHPNGSARIGTFKFVPSRTDMGDLNLFTPVGGNPAMARTRTRAASVPAPSLGSLTQQIRCHRCAACDSTRVTRLAMHLTDGTPVVFISCHRCEHRTWEHDGMPLTMADVLERTRKV